jgi:hypothetical protein
VVEPARACELAANPTRLLEQGFLPGSGQVQLIGFNTH